MRSWRIGHVCAVGVVLEQPPRRLWRVVVGIRQKCIALVHLLRVLPLLNQPADCSKAAIADGMEKRRVLQWGAACREGKSLFVIAWLQLRGCMGLIAEYFGRGAGMLAPPERGW